jgi:hypothetical protein
LQSCCQSHTTKLLGFSGRALIMNSIDHREQPSSTHYGSPSSRATLRFYTGLAC